MIEKLEEYFPKGKYKILIETDKDIIEVLLKSTASHTWGQGKIGNTGYYQLSRFTSTVGNNVVIICKEELTQKERK